MELHKFLHKLHLLIHGQFHTSEDAWYHLFADVVMVVEGPAEQRVKAFRLGLADVMEQCCPAEPKDMVFRGIPCAIAFWQVLRVGCCLCHIVEHFQCMIEIILVCLPVLSFHTLELCQFWEDERQ